MGATLGYGVESDRDICITGVHRFLFSGSCVRWDCFDTLGGACLGEEFGP